MAMQNAIDFSMGHPSAKLPLAFTKPRFLDRGMVKRVDSKAGQQDPSPEELMAAVAERRDRSAFVALFQYFAPRVKAYLIRLGADHSAAEDLVQDVMLTVWNRAHQFDRAKAATSTWIFTIARNRRIDVLRREKRPEIDPNDPLLVPSQDKPADQTLEEERAARDLKAAVATLPEEQATLLRMAYFEDKSHSVIADELSVPLGTVKSRLRLAMGKLRGALEDPE